MSSGKRTLFVYGSLKRDGVHHGKLRGVSFLGEARTAASYGLARAYGRYLALVPGAEAVSGELYEVTTALLEELDEFEGEAYERVQVLLEFPEPFQNALAYALKQR
jgi:gamma-glutamylcyclotransferase (GGCT)/AIG2-like uncharacterized protein YtfP